MMNRKFLLISFVVDDLRTIGACSIFAYAKSRGVNIKHLYLNKLEKINEIAIKNFLDAEDFGVIGIGLTTRDFYYAVKLTELIKKLAPDAFIFWGGVHPTCEPEECLEHVDCICIGEGEETVVTIVNNYENIEELKRTDGIALRLSENGTEQDSNVIINSAGYIENVDSLPYPYYEFDGQFYILDIKSTNVRKLSLGDYATYSKHGGDGYTLITSRSCPNNCSYCINSFYNKLYREKGRNRFFRRRSVKNTIDEIKYALKTIPTVQFINFLDDHFLTSDGWLEEFIELYGKEIGLPFIIRATPETITESRIKSLKEIGLKVVQMGIQSGSIETHRQIFHRHFDRDKTISAGKILHDMGIEGLYDFIIGNEFESVENKKSTIELMMELPKPYVSNVFHIIPFPKTDIVKWYKEHNITPRLNPYRDTYLDLRTDSFSMLAMLVPITDNLKVRNLLDSICNKETQREIRRMYDNAISNKMFGSFSWNTTPDSAQRAE